MNKNEATALVKDAFDADYSAESFVRFVSNLFKGEYTPLDKRRDGPYVREAFRSFVQGYRILGTYQDAEGTSLDILEVTLQRESSLERARTAQRNFIADYLKKNGGDAALVAFISPDQTDWRFSLVKLEYSLEVKDGKIKTEEELTPAKRWSFLIGRHEGSHTVQSRFISLLQEAEKPILKELEEAFNIESVTDEFFKKYCELFFRMKESLDKLVEGDPGIRADFDSKELTTVDFAKKTLGQMAFLYFLQKKGWFGVAPGKPWGTGPKDFLRQLFGRREKYGNNFFDDVLEPLFYEALAQDRGVEAIYPRLNNCRMPFLNGGLFEPMNGYSWETTNIRLSDELFSNTNKTSEGDVGDGILDVFDRYNFTVNENEPLEKEVAVDPEMLGKVFENLLEVKDRKSKGTYYTPREIVHYMCQESLINYLCTEISQSIPREDIEILIKRGSQIIQNDAMVLEKGKEGTYWFMLPENIRSSAKVIDDALSGIKVCDPAVGSGAFPLGMLNEIVQARQALAVHLRQTTTLYELKLHSISHSIYGVDIDPGAVEIAKLRLWLALVVEETEPHPLPNLEHKIMQGNSLVSEYEGVKLFDDSFLEKTGAAEKERSEIEMKLSVIQREYFALHAAGKLSDIKKFELEKVIKELNLRKKSYHKSNEFQRQELTIFDVPDKYREVQEKTKQLQQKVELFVSESSRSKKQRLKSEIDDLKWDLIELSLLDKGRSQQLTEVHTLRSRNIRPFFVWKLEFSDVFSENGGFDVLIGNPPYIKERDNKSTFDPVNNSSIGKLYHQGKMDFWYYFLHLSIDLSGPRGTIAFITPRYWINSQGARKLIERVRKELSFVAIVDIGKLKVFNDVAGHHMVAIYSKDKGENFRYTRIEDSIANLNQQVLVSSSTTSILDFEDVFQGGEILFRQRQLDLSETVLLGEICLISQGLVQNPDKVSTKMADKFGFNKGDGVFVLSNEERANLNLSDKSQHFIKPFFEDKSLSAFSFDNNCERHLIYLTKRNCPDIGNYPDIESHLEKYKKIMEIRRETISGSIDWFHLHWPRDQQIFDGIKIVMPSMFSRPSAAIIEEPAYFGMSSVLVTQFSDEFDPKYILAIMNSDFGMDWFIKNGKLRGAGVDIGVTKLRSFPIKIASKEQQGDIIKSVNQLIDNLGTKNIISKSKHSLEIMKTINDKVFDLYDIPNEERDSFIATL